MWQSTFPSPGEFAQGGTRKKRGHPFLWGGLWQGGVHPPYIRREGCLQGTGHARCSVLRSTDSGLRTGHAGLPHF